MISAECPKYGTIICKDSYTEKHPLPDEVDVTPCYGGCNVTLQNVIVFAFSFYLVVI